jgi:hypothetical protein
MTKQRIRLAYHEASHAVAARVQGVEVVSVLMFQTDENTRSSILSRSAAHDAEQQDTASRIVGLEIDIRVSLAGPVGDELHRKARSQSRAMRDGAADDVASSQNLAFLVALLMAGEHVPQVPHGRRMDIEVSSAFIESANVIQRRLRDETKVLLTEHWPAIERVAQALMTCNLLDQVELDRLIAG